MRVNSPTRPDTAARLRRLLAILAWLAQVGEAPVDDVAARFGLTPDALVTELEMAACCGVPPYTPDQLMEIVVTDTTVSTRTGIGLARPRRLSPHEGFALAASARALLAVEGSDDSGALSRALVKLERALGAGGVVVELDEPPLLALVRDAAASGTPLAISYYSASSDRFSEREITPLRVFGSGGHWYVDASCALAGGVRRFRVDRIQDAHAAGDGHRPDTFPGAGPPGAGPPPGFEPFVPGADTRIVRLSIEPSSAWILESIPACGEPVHVGDRIEVSVAVGGTAWLERLLLQLGPSASVIDPPEDETVVREAAARILSRYRGVHPTDRPVNQPANRLPPTVQKDMKKNRIE